MYVRERRNAQVEDGPQAGPFAGEERAACQTPASIGLIAHDEALAESGATFRSAREVRLRSPGPLGNAHRHH